MEVTGTVKAVGATETVGASGFQKRNLIVTTNEQYPQTLAIEFVQDKVGMLDNLKAGESVTVGINLRGREWVNPQGETKYFNSIAGWRIASTAPAAQQNEPSDDIFG